jgi:hypothetical protein
MSLENIIIKVEEGAIFELEHCSINLLSAAVEKLTLIINEGGFIPTPVTTSITDMVIMSHFFIYNLRVTVTDS